MTAFLRDLEVPVMTDEDWAARPAPMSALGTFGETAVGAFLHSPGLGSIAREGQLPDLALEPKPGEAFTIYQPRPAEAVAAEGDQLFTTPEQYKADPLFDERVPWEAGLTKSRLAAIKLQLSDQERRDYFSAQRPWTAFFGKLAGAAAEPLNYIPIVGEYAQLAALGRVGGTAFRFSLDAAANTAAVGLATSPERRQLGDDTSWGVLGQDIAFAGLAGLIGGAVVGRFTREKSKLAEQGSLPAPEAVVTGDELVAGDELTPGGPVRPSPVPETIPNRTKAAIVANRAVDTLLNKGTVDLGPSEQKILTDLQDGIRAFHGSPFEFDKFSLKHVGAGEGAQSYGHGLYFAEEPSVAQDYAATLGGKRGVFDMDPQSPTFGQHIGVSKGSLYEVKINAKASQFLDHDKLLSEQTPEVKAALAKAVDKLPKKPLIATALTKWDHDYIRGLLTGGFKDSRATGSDLSVALGRFLGGEDKAAQFLRENGVPGIKYFDAGSRRLTDAEILKEIPLVEADIAHLRNQGEAISAIDRAEIGHLQARVDLLKSQLGQSQSRNYVVFDDQLVQILKRNGQELSFAKPEPPSPSPERLAAESSINTATSSQDEIKLAKQEGLDIETGKHDLEEDVTALRAQGLTAEEEAELTEADDAFKFADGYSKALEAARTCKHG